LVAARERKERKVTDSPQFYAFFVFLRGYTILRVPGW